MPCVLRGRLAWGMPGTRHRGSRRGSWSKAPATVRAASVPWDSALPFPHSGAKLLPITGEPWALVRHVGFQTLTHTLARLSFLLHSEGLFIMDPHLPHCEPTGKPNFWGSSFFFPPV